MTKQDLIDNREQIIETINANAVAGSLKEVMSYMLKMTEAGYWNSYKVRDIEQITKNAIEDLELMWYQAPGKIVEMQNRQEAMLRNQMKVMY